MRSCDCAMCAECAPASTLVAQTPRTLNARMTRRVEYPTCQLGRTVHVRVDTRCRQQCERERALCPWTQMRNSPLAPLVLAPAGLLLMIDLFLHLFWTAVRGSELFSRSAPWDEPVGASLIPRLLRAQLSPPFMSTFWCRSPVDPSSVRVVLNATRTCRHSVRKIGRHGTR